MSRAEKPSPPPSPTLYRGGALLDQAIALRAAANGATPEEIAAALLRRQQDERRRLAETVAVVYRQGPDGEEEEIEVAVSGQWEGADPSVGIMTGGFCADRVALRIDDGRPLDLTDMEIREIEESETESASAYDGPDTWEEARGER